MVVVEEEDNVNEAEATLTLRIRQKVTPSTKFVHTYVDYISISGNETLN